MLGLGLAEGPEAGRIVDEVVGSASGILNFSSIIVCNRRVTG